MTFTKVQFSLGRILSIGLVLFALYSGYFTVGFATDLSVASPFSDHMVLQCEMPVPIWGLANPNTTVTVSFQNQQKQTIVGADGTWKVILDPSAPGGPYDLTISDDHVITLKDVLLGEVWVCSGQSNMAYGCDHFINGDPALAKMVGEAHPQVRVRTTEMPSWGESTPAVNKQYSAQGFAFAVTLNHELNRPVGIIIRSRPGMPASRFLDQDMFLADPDCAKDFQNYLNNWTDALANKLYAASLADWQGREAQKKALGQPEPTKPLFPTKPELKIARFGEELKNLKPFFGYAMRGVLWDQGEGLSGIPGVPQNHIIRALITGWRKQWGLDFPFITIQKPSGGGCAFDYADPVEAKCDPFGPLPTIPPPTSDGTEREAHIKIMLVPKTMLSIASDLAPGIHPPTKSGYAARNVRVALGFAYGKPVEYLGPFYKSFEIEGDHVRISFDHIGKGLVTRNSDKLQGFCLAGDDHVFHWSDAVIDKNTVVVSCKDVPKPVAVRYGWGREIPWANLFNLDGLPALTFRTDDWQ